MQILFMLVRTSRMRRAKGAVNTNWPAHSRNSFKRTSIARIRLRLSSTTKLRWMASFDSVVIVAEPSPGDWWSGEVGGVTLADIRTQVDARIAAKDSLVDTYRSNLPDGAELWLLLYSGVTQSHRSMPDSTRD